MRGKGFAGPASRGYKEGQEGAGLRIFQGFPNLRTPRLGKGSAKSCPCQGLNPKNGGVCLKPTNLGSTEGSED